jgi:hypothetical protein
LKIQTWISIRCCIVIRRYIDITRRWKRVARHRWLTRKRKDLIINRLFISNDSFCRIKPFPILKNHFNYTNISLTFLNIIHTCMYDFSLIIKECLKILAWYIILDVTMRKKNTICLGSYYFHTSEILPLFLL